MTNYLLNLGVSTASNLAAEASFQADNSNANPLIRSCVWLVGGSALTLADSFFQITQPMTQTAWSFFQAAGSPLQVYASQGYNILVRVFQGDTPVSPSYKLLLNAVFGQGSSTQPASVGVQSPLLVSTLPRTVIDSLQLAFATPAQQQTYWSVPSSDGAWTYCLGAIHGADNTYSFNAGASLCTNPAAGAPIYQYGLDPRVKVGMGVQGNREKAA